MPSFYVHVDVSLCEVFDEIGDSELQAEFQRRELKELPQTNARERRMFLTEASDKLRKAGDLSLAHRIDELMLELGV